MKYNDDKVPDAVKNAGIKNDNLEAFEGVFVPDLSSKSALVLGSKLYENKSVDRRLRYDTAFGVDMQDGDGVDYVCDLQECYKSLYGIAFSHIDCISVLEHIKKPWLACEQLDQLMYTGDSILISVPFVWREHGYPSDYWRYTPEAIKTLFPNIEWKKLCYMANGVEVKKAPSITADYQHFFCRTEVLGFGVKV